MRTLVIGATSAIAQAVARLLAQRGASFYLVARDEACAGAVAQDLLVRGARSAHYEQMDANDVAAHAPMLNRAADELGGIDTVIVAHGSLGDQQFCEQSVEAMMKEVSTNGLSVLALATLVGEYMAERRAGTLVVLSSVAGDRGRQSNYVYGSAKALVTTFLSGLRQRVHRHGVSVITVKPGPVDTPMTSGLAKGRLWSDPARVAAGIVRAIDRRSGVVYVPGYWRPIMAVIRSIPERAFQRLGL
jgi:decaprenylphospho-beta-D-erythro-pentofuranosid-2-ulose 2-reductase